jgi:4-alpha-glucanotransferase
MGLFRLFWIPTDPSLAGTYVRYPASDLLDILALESHRAQALVVGEDLGTVEDSVRHDLWERQVLSYRLLWFEPSAPPAWPEQALGAVTTHDLPTIPGVWSGEDPQASSMRGRLQERVALGDDAAVDDVVLGAYRSLAAGAPSVVVGTLDDALGVTERPNMPGTTDEWPNWKLALPEAIEDIEQDARVRAVARVLGEGR